MAWDAAGSRGGVGDDSANSSASGAAGGDSGGGGSTPDSGTAASSGMAMSGIATSRGSGADPGADGGTTGLRAGSASVSQGRSGTNPQRIITGRPSTRKISLSAGVPSAARSIAPNCARRASAEPA